MAVIGCCLAIFWPGVFSFGLPGVMAPVWQEMFHVGRGATGTVLFFMLASVGIFMFLVGRWQERYGTRTMIVMGVILSSLSSLVLAFAQSISILYFWAAIAGLSSCFVYIPALTTVQLWYPARKGLVSGIVSMIFGLSAAAMSPLLAKMLTSLGYFSMNVIIALLAIITGLCGAYLARAPKRAASEPDGMRNGGSIRIPEHLLDSWEKSFTVGESLRTRSFWFLWITWAMQGAAGVAMVTLSITYGLSIGLSMESAILILTAFNLTNGVGRLASGLFSDTLGRNRVMSAAFLASGIAYFVLPLSGSLATCALLAAVVGFAFGTLFAVSAPLVADCFGLKHFGAIFGLAFAAYGFVAGPLGPSLSGYLLDSTADNFLPVFLYLGSFCLISSVFIRYVKFPEGRAAF
jgi:OFA family oxalate/formate antiporter-like MFS transporter